MPTEARAGRRPATQASRRRRSTPGGARGAHPRARTGSDLVSHACEALRAVLTFRDPADAVLRRYFREHPALGRRDRAFVAETVFAVLRRRHWVERATSGGGIRRTVLVAATRLAGFDAAALKGAISDEEAAWLEQPTPPDPPSLDLAERAELPEWLVRRLRALGSSEDVLALGHALQRPAPLDLRVNTLLAERDATLAALRADGIACAPTALSPVGIRVEGKPALEDHALYTTGRIEVQDEGSQLIALLVSPRRRETVVDFCAGAGGKTLALGALMRSTGRLYALEVSSGRLARMKQRIARSGLSNVHAVAIAHENDVRVKRLAGRADRVLVDAPCTGFGTLRRNPDLKWRQPESALDELTAKQAAILASAARLPKPGGRLVYATCSPLAEENEAIVDAFLASHPEYRRLDCGGILERQGVRIAATRGDLRLTPGVHGTDGFYAAVLERSGPASGRGGDTG